MPPRRKPASSPRQAWQNSSPSSKPTIDTFFQKRPAAKNSKVRQTAVKGKAKPAKRIANPRTAKPVKPGVDRTTTSLEKNITEEKQILDHASEDTMTANEFGDTQDIHLDTSHQCSDPEGCLEDTIPASVCPIVPEAASTDSATKAAQADVPPGQDREVSMDKHVNTALAFIDHPTLTPSSCESNGTNQNEDTGMTFMDDDFIADTSTSSPLTKMMTSDEQHEIMTMNDYGNQPNQHDGDCGADGMDVVDSETHAPDADADAASIPIVQTQDGDVSTEQVSNDSVDDDTALDSMADQSTLPVQSTYRSPLPDHCRRTVLSRMFRWPFFALDVLYRFVTHPHRSDASASTSSLNQVVAEVQQESRKYRVFTDPRSTKSECQQTFYKDLRNKLEETSMSSCFSGIDTPATSFMCLAWAVTSELERSLDDLPSPKNLFAVEILSASQQELLCHPHTPQHIFGDMQEFWKPCIKEALPSIIERGKIEEELIPVVLSGVAARDHAYCLKHQSICKARQWEYGEYGGFE